MEATAEYERKLDAPEGFELPDLGGEPLEPRVFTSIYHDTPDRSLSRAGLTLRRRTERGRSVWQLKLPAGDARLELEEPGGPAGPPEALARLLVAHLRHGAVAPIAELHTRRHGTLVARNGTTAEVTIDDVSVMDALRVVEEFVEVEVELRTGKPKELDAIADALEHAGARPSDGTPKVFRVLRMPTEDTAPDDALAALRARLRAQLRTVLANDPGARLGRDPESVHDMRVAVRRSRALLRAGSKLYTDDVSALADELRWLGEKLGAVRDLDVLVDRLRGKVEELDEADRASGRLLVRTLERRRRSARTSLLKALGGDRYFALLDRFGAAIDELTASGSDLTVRDLARGELKKLRRQARSTPADASDDELHALRKRGKRVRYAYELAGKDAAVKRAKELQDVLGEHQDSVVAETTLRELAAAAPERAVAAGRLIERERGLRTGARASWLKAWRRLERATQ
ncbi:MAG TPA: CYTH and CHAD domain-containing protein [Gaiellaceae bacterium]|nr:CYTH and CHAD domain-containing protein [Gaiellaceae bacterium]